MEKFYVDKQGKYLGSFVSTIRQEQRETIEEMEIETPVRKLVKGKMRTVTETSVDQIRNVETVEVEYKPDVPENVIEVPAPPQDGRQIYDFKTKNFLPLKEDS